MSEPENTELTERQRYWLGHIRACDAAGQTSVEYARAHGIKVKSLYSARKALAENGALPPSPRTNGFQRVQVADRGHRIVRQRHVQLPNGLAVLVENAMEHDPFSERLFVFCNRRRNRIKILYWGRNDFCLWQKRLEEDRFQWPRNAQDEVVTLSVQQLNWLLDGYDISRLQPHCRRHYRTVL